MTSKHVPAYGFGIMSHLGFLLLKVSPEAFLKSVVAVLWRGSIGSFEGYERSARHNAIC